MNIFGPGAHYRAQAVPAGDDPSWSFANPCRHKGARDDLQKRSKRAANESGDCWTVVPAGQPISTGRMRAKAQRPNPGCAIATMTVKGAAEIAGLGHGRDAQPWWTHRFNAEVLS